MATHVHIHLRDGVYDPSLKKKPLNQRSEREQSAIKAHSSKAQSSTVVVKVKNLAGSVTFTEKLKLREGQEPQKAANDYVEQLRRSGNKVELVSFELK